MRSEGDGNPVYETPVYDNNRNPRANLEQNVEIADKPVPVISPNHAQYLGRCFACGKQNHFTSVCRSASNPPPPEVFNAHQNRTQNVSTSTKLTNMTHQASCQKKMKSMSIPQLPLRYRTPHFQTKASVSFHNLDCR